MADKNKKDKNQHIQVFVRVRPLNQNEKNKSSPCIIETSNKDVTIKERPQEKISRTFSYDKVFGMESEQIEVYKAVVAPLIGEVLQGYNCTVFAYGQTGTGKTFTMEGVQSDIPNAKWDSDPSSGIIPRTLSHLFDELRILQAEHTVRVSLLELYNEELFDLLSPTDEMNKIKMYEDVNKKGSVIVSGLEEITVHNKHEVYNIMEKGSFKRQTAATLMNAHSSRSHTVFSITVHIKENSLDGEELLKTGKLNLVDLAGSENVGKSGAVEKRAREAGNINQSLLTLGRCITALVERAPHVPFRESKLTRLLQDSLGGRTKTSIIATISPAACNMEETLSTLDYALRAKNITNKPEINQKLTKIALLKEYTEEMERLRRDLAATRDKNGVYLANDNYTQMINQLESQEQDILAKIANLRAVHEEMEKKEALLNELRISLDEKNDQLEKTADSLQQTRRTLVHTEGRLRVTEEDRDEHQHLVLKHAETEAKLGKQAKELLAVADQSTTDTHRLHDKLSRKRSVEDTNAEISREFRHGYQQKLAGMVDDVGLFAEEQLRFSAALQSNLGLHLETSSHCVDHASELVTSLLHNLNQQALDMQQKTSEEAAGSQEWVHLFLSSLRATSDSEGTALHEHRVDLSRRNQDLSRQLAELESGQADHARHVSGRLSGQREAARGHLSAQDHRLAHFREAVLQMARAQRGENERTRTALLGFQAEVSARQAQLLDEVAQMQERVRAEKAATNESFVEIAAGLARSDETWDKISKVVMATVEAESGHIGQYGKVYEAGVEELCENVGIFSERAVGGLATARRTHAGVETDLNAALEEGEEAWREEYARCEGEMRAREEKLGAQARERQAQVQALMNAARTTAERHEEGVEGQRTELGAFVRGARTGLDAQVAHLSEWTQATSNELRHRDQELDKFLSEDLRRDVPTGATPSRQDYPYSRHLPATSPHERILARYRATQRQLRQQQQQDEGDAVSDLSSISGDFLSASEEVVVVTSPITDEEAEFHVPRSASTSDIPASVSAAGSIADLNLSVSSEPGYKLQNKENGHSLFIEPLKPSKTRTVASKSKENGNVRKPRSGHKAPLTASSHNHH